MKKNILKSLQIRNLLSFGEDSPEIQLGNLNVLIGPNGSGKWNLKMIGLLRNTPKDFAAEVGDSGGVAEWLWKGKSKNKASKTTTATIYATADPIGVNKTISYRLSLTQVGSQLKITDERIENEKPDEGHEKPYLYFNFNGGRPVLNVAGNPRALKREEVDPQRSILSQRQTRTNIQKSHISEGFLVAFVCTETGILVLTQDFATCTELGKRMTS